MEQPTSRRSWWRRPHLSVRSLVEIVLIVGGGLGWFIRRATVPRDAVRAIEAAGGTVRYDFQQKPSFPFPSQPPGPKWLVDRIGIDFFANVIDVSFRTARWNTVVSAPPQNDAILADIGRLPRLEKLDASSVLVTDAGIAHLAGLTRLRSLEIQGTAELTDAGLVHLAGLDQLLGGRPPTIFLGDRSRTLLQPRVQAASWSVPLTLFIASSTALCSKPLCILQFWHRLSWRLSQYSQSVPFQNEFQSW